MGHTHLCGNNISQALFVANVIYVFLGAFYAFITHFDSREMTVNKRREMGNDNKKMLWFMVATGVYKNFLQPFPTCFNYFQSSRSHLSGYSSSKKSSHF